MSAKTTAKIIGDAMVINLQTATNKSVWRCSMDQLNHAVFAIKSKNKTHNLFLKVSDKEEEVASFDNKEDAEKALDVVTKALLSPIVVKSESPKKTSWFKRFFYLLLLILLVYFSLKIINGVKYTNALVKNKGAVQQNHVAPNDLPKGVPMTADEMFGS